MAISVAKQNRAMVVKASRTWVQTPAISLEGSLVSTTTQGYFAMAMGMRADSGCGAISVWNQTGAGSSNRPTLDCTMVLPASLTSEARTWRWPSKLATTWRRVTVCSTSDFKVLLTEWRGASKGGGPSRLLHARAG